MEATQDGAYEQDSATGNESVTVSVPGIGLKKLSMNTTQIQEKANAARAIYELATSLGSRFSSYSEVSNIEKKFVVFLFTYFYIIPHAFIQSYVGVCECFLTVGALQVLGRS